MKKFLRVVLVCGVMVWSLGIPVGASGTAGTIVGLEELQQEAVVCQEEIVPLAVVSLNVKVSAGKMVKASSDFYLETGETVEINVSYSPKSASMDFGLIGPDGLFHYVSADDGNLDKTIQVNERGYYTFAMRNNSPHGVQVTGFVNY